MLYSQTSTSQDVLSPYSSPLVAGQDQDLCPPSQSLILLLPCGGIGPSPCSTTGPTWPPRWWGLTSSCVGATWTEIRESGLSVLPKHHGGVRTVHDEGAWKLHQHCCPLRVHLRYWREQPHPEFEQCGEVGHQPQQVVHAEVHAQDQV